MAAKRSAKLTLETVGAFAAGLPNVVVGTKWNRRTWMVREHGFCWERPLGKADLARLGDQPPPAGDVIAVCVENLDAKDALLAMELPGVFTIQHFNAFPAVLIELRLARPSDVRAAIESAWAVASARPPRKQRAARPRARHR